ncbi:protein kinase domain-containing protein [Corallococcus aberystwythensis]|uniref:non-specific serine/threonine protein kinase n=1 Tax=Corallococcus aberystwythensis TaxID=2316722 RepID=A0A3A8QG70_9BACT|nr:protein kinase [Corallococcus aberystwythensis]RKH62214.1 PEGA domain-containing protein [Corallococcus aberystwythensis]
MSIETYGSYQLLKRLATGGMAQIYLARRPGSDAPDKLLVLKRILPHLSENDEFVRMFLDEARIAARLAHPNVVQIYDLGAEGDTFFIAMEYIHGVDARRLWKRSETAGLPLPVPLVCRILLEACAGLDYAHKKTDATGRPLDIVHRDVSPQNILVTFDGGVKVVDFGIAKAADQATVTRSGVLKGKYSYMSPEQASGQRVDRRSDVFALGVVLHELLTGGRLFKRPSDMLTLSAVAECHVPVPSVVAPRVPVELDAIVLKALAKDPDARYQHAQELQRALEGWLASQPQPFGTTADLAAYMRQLYADRLTEEARSGEVQVTDEEAGVSPPSPAPRRSVMRPATAPGRTENEPTTTLRPGRANRPSVKVEARREDAEGEGGRSDVRGPDTRPEGRNAEARADARNAEARSAEPRGVEARGADARGVEPRSEARSAEPRADARLEGRGVPRAEARSEGRTPEAYPDVRAEARHAEARGADVRAEPRSEARGVDVRPEPRSEVRSAEGRPEPRSELRNADPRAEARAPDARPEPRGTTGMRRALESPPSRSIRPVRLEEPSLPTVTEEDGPTLAMMDTQGKLSGAFEVEEDGPTLAMVDTEGKLSGGFQVEEDAPTLDQRFLAARAREDEDDSTLDMRAVSRADVDEGPTQDMRAVPRSEIPVPRAGGPAPSGEHRGQRLPVPAPHATLEMTASTAPRSASRAPMPGAWVPPARTGTLTEQSAVEPPKRRALLYGAIVLVAILVGIGIVWGLGAGSSGVHVESEPAGARVVFEDRVLPERTPLTLPTVKPGRYWVVLVKEGYRELRTQIVIPPSGQLDVGPLKLVPMPSSGKPATEPPASAPPAAKTPEPGVGPSGVAAPRTPDAAASEAKQAQEAPRAQAPAPVVKAPVATAATVVPAAEVREPVRAVEKAASVSFVVMPWAEVSCNGRKLGQTPFKPVELQVGSYDCKFTNAELQRTLTRRIEVRPIDLNVVTVKFE